MTDSNQLAIKLAKHDYLALHHITRQVLRMFPEEIVWSKNNLFDPSSIWVPPYPQPSHLTFGQIVAGAYYGYLPIPIDYRKFCDDAERINRNRTCAAAEELRRDEVRREGDAAQEFGLPNRRAVSALYENLKVLAKQHGFPTIKLLWKCQKYIQKVIGEVTEGERSALAAGPLFLWDIVQCARTINLGSVTFAAYGQWILYLRQSEDGVLAYAINPASLRIGGFENTPLPTVSEEVRAALRALARDHYPSVPPENVYFEEFPVFEQAMPHPSLQLAGV